MINRIHLYIVFIILAGCGGGGGGGSSGPPALYTEQDTPTTTPPNNPVTPTLSYDELKEKYENNYEYISQWGLKSVNAASAYARGATGSNIIIGVTDSGLDTSHEEISYMRIDSRSDLSYSNYVPNTRQKRHGTMVSSVAAGILSENDDSPMHGVAFDADIFFIAIQLAEPDENYDPIDLGDSSGDNSPDYTGVDNFFSQLFNIYSSYDVDIVNNSYGYAGNITDYTEAQLRSAFPKTIEAMAQLDTNDSDKTIFVWSAGNAGSYADQGVDFSSPEVLPGIAAYISEVQGHSIAVVSIDESGEISDFSSRCGIAAEYCIAAPGAEITVAYPVSQSDQGIYDDVDRDCETNNSCYAITNGTSFASPFVAGGLAVIADHFEGQLGSTELVERLFATANKEGVYANSEIYGQGLMDLDAATSPVGQLTATLTSSIDGIKVPLHSTIIDVSSMAFGDSIINNLSNQSLILFDELNAPFRYSLTNFITDIGQESLFKQKISPHIKHTNQKIVTQFGSMELRKAVDRSNIFQSFNTHINEAYIENSYGFLISNNEDNYFISSGFNFDSSLGFFNHASINQHSYLKEDIGNPWSKFTKNGITVGKEFLINDYKITFINSIGRPETTNPFKEKSTNNSIVFNVSNYSEWFSMQFGALREKNSSVGLNGSGAFSSNSKPMTKFIGMNLLYESNWGLFFSNFYHGNTNNNSSNIGFIKNIQNLQSESFNLGYKPFLKNNKHQLILSVNQPLRLKSGTMNLKVPVYRSKNKQIFFNNLNIDLQPSGREINSKIDYSFSENSWSIQFGIGYKQDAYHSKYSKDYWFGNISFMKYLY
tara:strand:+ start:29680 stop:32151 length:2472 start_codon:yes stop_codon:yes gene_type:complete